MYALRATRRCGSGGFQKGGRIRPVNRGACCVRTGYQRRTSLGKRLTLQNPSFQSFFLTCTANHAKAGSAMKQIHRKHNAKHLVHELGNNKVDVLELLREALSNAKDHEAKNLFMRVRRDNRGRVSVLFMDDGHGLTHERWEAFWGTATSIKLEGSRSVGYKGFGTKLFFHCARLSVVSRAAPEEDWLLVTVDQPSQDERTHYEPVILPESHELYKVLKDNALLGSTATAILIEDLHFPDNAHLLSYERIISFCDWFTILGDIRAGLFSSRKEFHRAIQQGGRALDGLHTTDVPLRPIQVHVQINGDKRFLPLGEKSLLDNKSFFGAWEDDTVEFQKKAPELWMFGHRFADSHVGAVSKGGQQKNDGTALCLTSKTDWTTEDGYAVVAHIEGHRRQRETYPEAGATNRAAGKKAVYSFDDRFGLWLCRDFIPVTQRNDLLKRAILEAGPRGLDRDFKTLRNWKIFVNHQGFQPIANRTDISNFAQHESRIFEVVRDWLKSAFKQADFQRWIEKIQSARRDRERDTEVAQMRERREEVIQWNRSRTKEVLDLSSIALSPRNPKDALHLREPKNEQEVFYLYAQLSARFEVPVFIWEYDTHEGVDAIGRVLVRGLVPSSTTDGGYARIEFKRFVESGVAIGHYFDAIDVIICWEVKATGDIEEAGDRSIPGKLQERIKNVLTPQIDTYEIVYQQADGANRVIPVLELKKLFPVEPKPRKSSRASS